MQYCIRNEDISITVVNVNSPNIMQSIVLSLPKKDSHTMG